MATAIVNPLLAAEPFEEASEGPRSPVSEREMKMYYEEQERQDMQRRLSKSWRRSFKRSTSGKNVGSTGSKATSEPDSEAYGTGQEESLDDHPSTTDCAPPTPGPAMTHRKAPGGRPSEGVTPRMPPPPPLVRDQSNIPPHMRRYEIYQPPSFVARAPPRYYNFHLLSASAKDRLQRELALSYTQGRLPSLVSSGSVFSGVGSGTAGGSVRSSLSVRRPSMLGAVASSHFGGSAGFAGLETITASPASTAAPLGSPSLDPMSALNAGPAANHRLSTWLKRPPASPRTSMQPLPADATDLMDGTDPFGGAWHHSSPYDAGEMVVGRGFGRTRDSSFPDTASPHTRSVAGPSNGGKKGPSPLSQSTSAINLTDTEPPLPDPPGSPDLLSGTRTKRKLSKRRSTSASRGGLTSLFTRKPSVDEDHPEGGGRTGGLRGRSRPPLSPSSQSLAQTQGIAFPTDGTEKRPRRKLSKRGRSRSSSAASVDSSRSIETPIHTQFAKEPARDIEIVELPSAKAQSPQPQPQPQPQPRPASQRPPSQRPPSFQHHRPPSSQHHSAPEAPLSAPPLSRGPAPPSVTTNKQPRERKISAASINSFLSRITSRDKDKDKDKEAPRSASVQDHRKVPPHKLLNHVGKDHKSGNMFTRFARKLSLIRRRSVDVMANPEANSSRPSFTVERRPGTAQGGGAKLERRATLDMTPSRSTTYRSPEPAFSPAPPSRVLSSEELFAPIDPQLRASRLINAQLSPPPRIPDLTLPGDRNSWAASLHRKVSTKSPHDPPPTLDTEDLLPPPPIGGRHPDSPHSIPRWGIQAEKAGPLMIEGGASPTDDDSPVSTSKGVLTIANPDMGESEADEGSVPVYGNEVALYGPSREQDRPASIDGLKALRAQLEAVASPESRRNRELPPEPGVKATQPLVVRKDLSRSPSPVKALSGQESPLKRGGRDSPVKRGGRDSPVKRGRRDHSPVKPVRRSEPLKDHSAVNGADVQKSHGFRPVGGPGRSLRLSAAIGSTTSVDAIQGDDDAELGAKPVPREDPTGRQRMVRSRASTDSIGKMHVITPKTSLQKIRVRVVSNPPPVEISKESSPVKDDPPAVAPTPERTKSTKNRPRSGYTGVESRHSIYGTATSESSEGPTSPRKRISTVGPDAPPRRPTSKPLDTTGSKIVDPSTPYLTPTGDAPLHPFSEKPVAYQNMMPPISVMRFETVSPPPGPFIKRDAMGSSKMVFADSKGAWMEIDSPTTTSPPPKAPYINDEFSVSKEKLAAREEFTKHHKRESTAESERRREAKEERARQRAELAERAEYERVERERERAEYERAERERLERAERERQERERAKQEARARAEQERLERIEQERLEQERLEQERLEQERLDREREYAERVRAERERVRAAQRQKEEQERIERIARERDRERVEKERIEKERQELERERLDRERAEQKRLDWERLERERLMEEEMRRREPPALLPTNSGRRTRHEAYEEREIPITSPKEPRKSRRRSPNESRSTSPTSTVPPPPPKENQPIKSRPRAQTDAYVPPITNALPPPVQPSIEVIAGVPVLPQGTHVEVAQPFQPRPTSVNTIEAPSLKARDAWERERLDKGQSVMVPGGQRAVIPDIGSPRPTPDPRQRQPSNKVRSQTPLMSHSEPVVPPLSEYGPSHSSYSIPTFPPSSRSHNPLPKPPTIDGPFPLHRPGQAYTNPNRQLPGQGRPSGARNPLPQPPRVSSYPLHHNVSPPRGPPPGAGR